MTSVRKPSPVVGLRWHPSSRCQPEALRRLIFLSHVLTVPCGACYLSRRDVRCSGKFFVHRLGFWFRIVDFFLSSTTPRPPPPPPPPTPPPPPPPPVFPPPHSFAKTPSQHDTRLFPPPPPLEQWQRSGLVTPKAPRYWSPVLSPAKHSLLNRTTPPPPPERHFRGAPGFQVVSFVVILSFTPFLLSRDDR